MPSTVFFLLALVALLAVQIGIFPLLELFKKCLLLDSHAHLASKAPSATTTAAYRYIPQATDSNLPSNRHTPINTYRYIPQATDD